MTYAVSLIERVATDDGKVNCETADSAVVIGLIKRQHELTPVEALKSKTDLEYVLDSSHAEHRRCHLLVSDIVYLSSSGGSNFVHSFES